LLLEHDNIEFIAEETYRRSIGAVVISLTMRSSDADVEAKETALDLS